jgi:hypothetical protein
MTWFKLVGLVLQIALAVTTWLRNRELIAVGRREAVIDAMEAHNARIKEALATRRRARDSDPDPDDPYRRD